MYTLHRKPGKTGLVLLEAQVSVADDGFVSVASRFLAPQAGLAANDFAIDSNWPLSTLPAGLPSNQGGPYLASKTIKKQNGLTTVDAIYVTAVNPIRTVVSSSDTTGSFSGWAAPQPRTDPSQGNLGVGFVDAGGLLVFDYVATTVTTSYSLVEPNQISPQIKRGFIKRVYNQQSVGAWWRVGQAPHFVQTTTEEVVGRVKRISVTSTPKYQANQYDRLRAAAPSS
jgi:hypothetical protein